MVTSLQYQLAPSPHAHKHPCKLNYQCYKQCYDYACLYHCADDEEGSAYSFTIGDEGNANSHVSQVSPVSKSEQQPEGGQ